jgi:1-acyl-sn-glycerol-3-phosphate acyltransferase
MKPVTPFERPSKREIERVLALAAPWAWYTRPKVVGVENVPDDQRPLLFVGNHTLGGVLDAPLMFVALYRHKDIFLRSLGDHLHFKIPGWREGMARWGVVDGTRENCAALMKAGECVLVFPGGGREVAKRKGEKYKLVWKKRTGFARMAIEHGCTVVPFAAVGVEDALDVIFDADQLMDSPLGVPIRRLGLRTDVIPPIMRGIGPTMFPRPQRYYFQFRPAISTQSLAGKHTDDDVCWTLREEIRGEIERGIEELREIRQRDPRRSFRIRVREDLGALAAKLFPRPFGGG